MARAPRSADHLILGEILNEWVFGDAALASNTAARVLGQERDEGVRERALTVLSELGSVPLEPLLRCAASAGHPDLRVRALQSAEGGRRRAIRVVR